MNSLKNHKFINSSSAFVLLSNNSILSNSSFVKTQKKLDTNYLNKNTKKVVFNGVIFRILSESFLNSCGYENYCNNRNIYELLQSLHRKLKTIQISQK